MKRYIKSTSEQEALSVEIDEIVSVVLVDDVTDFRPEINYVSSASKIDYSTLTREQILQMPKRQREYITDINALRKLKKDELTFNQQRLVTLANNKNFISKVEEVKEKLSLLKACKHIHIENTEKNDSFAQEIFDMGGDITDTDARNIVKMLRVNDYSYSTLSYLDKNWNALLMVFGFNGPYTFKAYEAGNPDVTVDTLSLYIKIDVDNETRKGYAAMSFHRPDFKLTYPYADYKE